jgi:hypothetical protein
MGGGSNELGDLSGVGVHHNTHGLQIGVDKAAGSLGGRNVGSKRARWAALAQCALHEAYPPFWDAGTRTEGAM